MSVIQKVLVSGVIIYLAILLWQIAGEVSITGQAVLAAAFLLAAGAITFARDKGKLKQTEMIVLWACVFLFAVYTIARYGGWAW